MAVFTNPASNTEFYAEAWGNGGGGAGVGPPFAQGGGGGGAYANVHVTGLTGGETYTSGNGGNGWGLSGGSQVLFAADVGNNTGVTSDGGRAAACTGDHTRNGGNGFAPGLVGGPGGGGGGGARRGAAGPSATNVHGASNGVGDKGGEGGSANQPGNNAVGGPGNGGGGYGGGSGGPNGTGSLGGVAIWLAAQWDSSANGGFGGPKPGATPIFSDTTYQASPVPAGGNGMGIGGVGGLNSWVGIGVGLFRKQQTNTGI